jgi:hypothetical protein
MKTNKSNLSRKAMLIDVRISGWTGRIRDKELANEVSDMKKAKRDTCNVNIYLVPKNAMKRIWTYEARVRKVNAKYTLPWMDGGIRILPSAVFGKYSDEMRKVVAEYEEVVEDFLKMYPTYKDEARDRLGDMIVGKTMPSAQTIRAKFSVRKDILPIPDASDFRVGLTDKEVSKVKKNITDNIEAMTTNAMKELWNRFAELVGKIEESASNPEKKFYKSTIANLRDFCKLIPKMNLTDNKDLESLRKVAEDKLTKLDAGVIRDNKTERKKAHKDAKDVLKKMKSYMG